MVVQLKTVIGFIEWKKVYREISTGYQSNRACFRHVFLRRFATMDSSIKLFPRKKSVAMILAAFHHSSLYH